MSAPAQRSVQEIAEVAIAEIYTGIAFRSLGLDPNSCKREALKILLRAIAEAVKATGAREALDDASWSGDGPNAADEFYCPFCKAHDESSELIPHDEKCSIANALAALDELGRAAK